MGVIVVKSAWSNTRLIAFLIKTTFLSRPESKHKISAKKWDSANTKQVANNEKKSDLYWPGLLRRELIQASDVLVWSEDI